MEKRKFLITAENAKRLGAKPIKFEKRVIKKGERAPRVCFSHLREFFALQEKFEKKYNRGDITFP